MAMRKIIFLTFLFLFYGCSEKDKELINSEKVIFIPDSSLTTTNAIYHWKNEYCNQLDLPLVEENTNKEIIRIWIDKYEDYQKGVFELTKNDNHWSGQYYIFIAKPHTGKILKKRKIEIEDNDFTDIINHFKNLGISGIPTWEKIWPLNDITSGGYSFYIEISNPKFYRFFVIFNPFFFSKQSEYCFLLASFLNKLYDTLPMEKIKNTEMELRAKVLH